jgi:hypothetical protein
MAGLPNFNADNRLAKFCNDGTQQRALVFDGTNGDPQMSIVQGASTLFSIDLSQFFIPLVNYQSFDFIVPALGSVELNSTNIVNKSGQLQFLGILVTYPDFDCNDETIDTCCKYLTFQYPLGVNTFPLGKIMLLSGSTLAGFGWDLETSPGGFLINNPHNNFDVEIQVLVFE